jgi:hypothetical protein
MVIAKLLDNPRLTENDVVFLAARRPAPSDALGEVGRHPRWRRSKRVATALVLNPYTPPRIGMTLLHMLTLDEIKDTTRDDRLQLLLRKAAREVLSECKRD